MSSALDTVGLQNLAYVEQLWLRYKQNADSVPSVWRKEFGQLGNGELAPSSAGPAFQRRSIFDPGTPGRPQARFGFNLHDASLQDRLNQLIRNHRVRGHRMAAVNPLGPPPAPPPELELSYYGFTEKELDTLTGSASLPYDQPLTVREIFQRLRNTYCRSIGVQFMHIDDVVVRRWLQLRMEGSQNRMVLSRQEQVRILTRLTDAVIFEEFLRRKFVGAKTFSLEGSETLLPLLDLAIEWMGEQGLKDIVLGMAHRGRLNVLAHIIGKDSREILRELLDDDPARWEGHGDVRHHLGFSGEWITGSGRRVHLSLCFNPSHLEFINPVVLGRVRARQDRLDDRDRRKVCGILIHGDAAFAGQGVVQETLNLSQLTGYGVGGVLHVIVNNQIGFTTPPAEARSTPYATDVARMLSSPIFHVNGEDPEAVAQVVRLSLDFRREFQSDVVIDLYGYRRWGHNETDEPSFTQPILYRQIGQRSTVRQGYLEHLLKLNDLTAAEAELIAHSRRERLEQMLSQVGQVEPAPAQFRGVWEKYFGGAEPQEEPDTGYPSEQLAGLLRRLTDIPAGFQLHTKLQRALGARHEMSEGKRPLDWSAAEALALATLAIEGVRIRLTGQDSARGTFSQRHVVLHDQENGLQHVPLQHLAAGQGAVEVVNSPLNETGSLGFEYGYSLDEPSGLILWEAQFGDFVNAAQVIIDQFLASGEDKWRRLSGLVLLLPHGFEGMGAEHSSARLERFLALAAEDNMQIVQPTTPAQYFHCLRRQTLRPWRKPLIVFTPKSLLRHPQVVSPLEEFTSGLFQRVLPDSHPEGPCQCVLLCSGKVYFDLLAYRDENHLHDVALIRLEQLYPWQDAPLTTALSNVVDGTPVVWVQEEPENMGAWRYLRGRFGESLFGRFPLRLISRPESASPASGSHAVHEAEQQDLVRRAFDPSHRRDAPSNKG
jgi:2-oxoglutarate dehydrogenase E1 component